MALAERRTAAAGGGQATVSTPTGVWTELTTAMVNAGWVLDTDWSAAGAWPAWTQSTVYPLGSKVTANGNRYYAIQGGTSLGSGTGPSATTVTQADGSVVWEYASTSATTADAIYSSTGESGNEKMWARVWVNSTWVNVELYQYFSANIKYNAFNCARTSGISTNQKNQQFNYSGATTINFAVIADKDSVFMTTVDQTNARRSISFGLLRRFPGVNTNTFVSNNAVTAGANKTFTFSSGDPVAAGYKPYQPIMIISQQTTGSASFVIPCFSTRIVSVTTNSITVLNVPENVSAGALVGQDPFPAYCVFSQATSFNPFNANAVVVHNYHDDTITNTYTPGGQAGTVVLLDIPIRDTAVAELDPNNRTGYQQVTEQICYNSGIHPRGMMMKAYAWNTNANNQWTIAKEVRTTAKDWLFQRDTPPSTGSAWLIGPFTATTATVNFQSYTFDTDWGYREVEIYSPEINSIDRSTAGFANSNALQQGVYLGGQTWMDTESEYLVWADPFYYYSSGGLSRWFNGYLFTGELYPFDTAIATLGGSSNGFNVGFN